METPFDSQWCNTVCYTTHNTLHCVTLHHITLHHTAPPCTTPYHTTTLTHACVSIYQSSNLSPFGLLHPLLHSLLSYLFSLHSLPLTLLHSSLSSTFIPPSLLFSSFCLSYPILSYPILPSYFSPFSPHSNRTLLPSFSSYPLPHFPPSLFFLSLIPSLLSFLLFPFPSFPHPFMISLHLIFFLFFLPTGQPACFCHLMTRTCWGHSHGVQHLQDVLIERKKNAPQVL